MKPSTYGPCGLFCGACGATDCNGCLSDNVDEYVVGCKFRTCSKERGLDFCCHCSDCPCDELDAFMHDKWPHHWTMEPNLEYIKNNGVDAWLRAQHEQWSCRSCGAEVNWYQKSCACGQPFDAWEVPE